VIIYDVTSLESFQNLEKWVDDVKKERGPDATVIVAGNKIDLERTVSKDAAEQKAREFGLTYYEAQRRVKM
jgi:Ras-related protein Rab-6A